MPGPLPDGGTDRHADDVASGSPIDEAVASGSSFDVEEFRRRNVSAVAMDVLYLLTTGYFATLPIRGFWPAVIAALPLAAFVYFAWKSSTAFFVANLLVIVLVALATYAGLVPF